MCLEFALAVNCPSNYKLLSVDFQQALVCYPRYYYFYSHSSIHCQCLSRYLTFVPKALLLIRIVVVDFHWDRVVEDPIAVADASSVDSVIAGALENRNNLSRVVVAVDLQRR